MSEPHQVGEPDGRSWLDLYRENAGLTDELENARKWIRKALALQEAQQARLDAMTEADGLLRKLLWLRHGCGVSALYGDDGEMQCGKCGIDFKRWSAADILQRLQAVNQEAFQRALLASPGTPQEK